MPEFQVWHAAGRIFPAARRFLDAIDLGKEQASRLRSFIVSVLGPKNPQLKLFGINPKAVPNPNNRPSRRRKSKKPETPAQTPGNPPASGTPTGEPPVVAKAAE